LVLKHQTIIYKPLKIKTMSSSKIITGVLIGAAAGAVLGILFAPDKGSDTRKKISKKGTDLKDTLKTSINDLVDSIADHFENVKNEAENMVEEGKEKIASAKSQVKNSLS
jgi:gas vesicle protein